MPDALIMPAPPPQLNPGDGAIQVYFTTTVQAEPTKPGLENGLQISFAVTYVYGATQLAKVNAIKQRAYDAYVDYCTPRGITPVPINQFRAEVVGVT